MSSLISPKADEHVPPHMVIVIDAFGPRTRTGTHHCIIPDPALEVVAQGGDSRTDHLSHQAWHLYQTVNPALVSTRGLPDGCVDHAVIKCAAQGAP